MSVKIEQLVIELKKTTDDACRALAEARIDAKKDIASAVIDAKNLIASDAARAVKVEEKRTNGNGLMDFVYKQGTLGVALVGVCFGVYFTFANPTQDNDTAIQLQDQRLTAQRQIIDELTKTAQKDTKELKSEITGLRVEVQTATNQIIKLQTILEERLPLKK